MSEDPRITEAKRLMREVDFERRQKEKAQRQKHIDEMVCKCGHLHKDHLMSHSINYSKGFCDIPGCECRNFLIQTK